MAQTNDPDPYLPVYGRRGQETPHGAPVQPAPRRASPRTAGPPLLWKFTVAQWLVLGGGALTVLGSLLPWYTITFVLLSRQQSLIIAGWDVPTGKVTLLLGIAALAFFGARLLRLNLPIGILSREPAIYMALGAEAFLVALLYLLDGPRVLSSGGYYSSGSALGLYLALIGAATIAIGGYLRRRDQKSWLL